MQGAIGGDALRSRVKFAPLDNLAIASRGDSHGPRRHSRRVQMSDSIQVQLRSRHAPGKNSGSPTLFSDTTGALTAIEDGKVNLGTSQSTCAFQLAVHEKYMLASRLAHILDLQHLVLAFRTLICYLVVPKTIRGHT